MKKIYEQPQAELFELRIEGALLTNSVESMEEVVGSWDELIV
jgi:hypothetical protein